MPSVHSITIYPIKSFDGREVSAATVLPSGALLHDRRYALVDKWGKFVNGKNCPEIHRIRAKFNEELSSVMLSCGANAQSFALEDDSDSLAEFCSELLGQKCRLISNLDGGYPDDSESPGPTLVSTSTLMAIGQWFDGIELDEVRRRFRFNIEIADAEEFWEDGLVPELQKLRRFRIGGLVWQGSGICRRCVVPTRDSLDGAVSADFAKEFVRRRQEMLPDWAPRDRFDTYYRLGVNTRLDSEADEQVLQVGDAIEVI